MQSGETTPVDEASAAARVRRAWDLLEEVTDPEIPVISLREMGILRDVRSIAGGLEVVITPTYSGCPAMAQIEDDVRDLLAAHAMPARVLTQLAPAWTTDWLSETARAKLLAYGIAPPTGKAQPSCGVQGQIMRRWRHQDNGQTVRCPRCGSDDTTVTSHFGSTACKALYRCLTCLEPFDHFKNH